MARVLYGVMGDTYGHLARTQAIVSRLPEHEFYFIGGGRVPEVLDGSSLVLPVPFVHTVLKNEQVSASATCLQLFRRAAEVPRVRRQIVDLIHRWQPDLAICDHEFFLPIAARKAGLPCISLDHGHVLLSCKYPVPPAQRWSWTLAMLQDGLFFNFTRHNLITSFFHPPLKPGRTDELFPPVLRKEVGQITPRDGDHVLCYQTSPTHHQLIDALGRIQRPVIVYGYRHEHATDGHVTFKPFDQRSILEDLASCAYVVVNGGHNVICEALYFGKPVLCFPPACHFEQFLNSWHVRQLGYGDFSFSVSPELFHQFEKGLDLHRKNIRQNFVDGTSQVVARVHEIIAQQSLPAH